MPGEIVRKKLEASAAMPWTLLNFDCDTNKRWGSSDQETQWAFIPFFLLLTTGRSGILRFQPNQLEIRQAMEQANSKEESVDMPQKEEQQLVQWPEHKTCNPWTTMVAIGFYPCVLFVRVTSHFCRSHITLSTFLVCCEPLEGKLGPQKGEVSHHVQEMMSWSFCTKYLNVCLCCYELV